MLNGARRSVFHRQTAFSGQVFTLIIRPPKKGPAAPPSVVETAILGGSISLTNVIGIKELVTLQLIEGWI